MLKLEFLGSSDKEIIGSYLTYKNSLLIGRSNETDIIVSDSELEGIHLSLFLTKDGLFITNRGLTSSFYHVNGKKIFGDKKSRPNDTIRVGQTSFKIIDFSFDCFDDEEVLRKEYTKIKEEPSEVMVALDELKIEYTSLLQKNS